MQGRNENSGISRRGFIGAAAAGAYALASERELMAAAPQRLRRPDSTINGVKVGLIAPYAFRGEATTAGVILERMVQLGLSWVELQSPPIEAFAGAPQGPGRGPQAATPEQQAARRSAAEELRRWRLSASMDRFRELRRMYEDAGVTIDIVKFGLGPGMTDDETEYAFEVAKAVGAYAITCEPPVSETKRLGQLAARHKIMLGYHGHANVTGVEAFARPGSWEQAFFYSPFNGANLDIGHFTAGNSRSPVDFIREYHPRITNLHLKDRKVDQGPNLRWGEGDTPIREVLQLMRREKYPFMATIELEYPIPSGSSVMAELAKCVDFCRKALE